MKSIEEITQKAMNALEGLEFATFVVGVSEGDLTLKQKIKALVEKEIIAKTGAKKDNSNPQVQVMIGQGKNPVRLLIEPLFVSGRYQKLERGIPQTKWPCRDCKGNGCAKCDYTGYRYKDSVEQTIAAPLLEQAQGMGHSLHGAGREDRDARMLGTGRPFVIEIKEPRKRHIDLEKAAEEINKGGKVKITGLKMASRYEIKPLKASRAEKTYSALVKAESPMKKEELLKLKELIGEIKQKTPQRVLHRRSDLERARRLIELDIEYIDETHFRALLRTEAGLYVKELISGDNGRTKPNMSELLGNRLVCEELDVLDVDL